MSESWGLADVEWANVKYERDSHTNSVTALTLTCPDRRGIPLSHSSLVRQPGGEDRITVDLVQTHCSAAHMRSRVAE